MMLDVIDAKDTHRGRRVVHNELDAVALVAIKKYMIDGEPCSTRKSTNGIKPEAIGEIGDSFEDESLDDRLSCTRQRQVRKVGLVDRADVDVKAHDVVLRMGGS